MEPSQIKEALNLFLLAFVSFGGGWLIRHAQDVWAREREAYARSARREFVFDKRVVPGDSIRLEATCEKCGCSTLLYVTNATQHTLYFTPAEEA